MKTHQAVGCSAGSALLFLSIFLIGAPMASLADEVAGIGAALKPDGETFIIRMIMPDSPAAASQSLHEGDRILAVGHESDPPVSVKGLKLAKVVELVRGAKGSTVRLTIVPAGKDDSESRVVSLVRGELQTKFFLGDLLAIGSEAPALAMLALPGDARENLADYRGKIVVLEFWATWCQPCQKAMAELQTLLAKHPEWKDRVALIAVSIDDEAEAAGKHLQAQGWNQSHNVWITAEAVKEFHVNAAPTVYVLDPAGKVVAADHGLDIPQAVNRLLQQMK